MKRIFSIFSIAALVGLFSFQPAHSQIVNPTQASNVIYTPPFTGGVNETQAAKNAQTVSIKDFGGNEGASAATNTTALTKALATNKAVYIPAGTYAINAITVPLTATLYGDGSQLSILNVTGGQNGLTVGANPPATYGTVSIRGLQINCGTAHTGYGMNLNGVVDSNFDDLLIQNCEYGWYTRTFFNNNIGRIKFYNNSIGWKAPKLGVDGNQTFNSINVGVLVSEANLIAGLSWGYVATTNVSTAQLENQLVGAYIAEGHFLNLAATYWEWAGVHPGAYTYIFGVDENGIDGDSPSTSINAFNVMTSSYNAGVSLKNVQGMFLSGEIKSDGTNLNIVSGVSGLIIQRTDSLALQAGSAANPPLSFLNDLGTGIFQKSTSVMGIATAGTERAAVNAIGFTKLSNTGTYNGIAGTYHEIRSDSNGSTVARIDHTSATDPYGISVNFTAAAPNNNTNFFATYTDNAATRAIIYSNGGLGNFQANNVNLSDRKTKRDITKMPSQWDSWKSLDFKLFRKRDEFKKLGNAAPKYAGLLAQDVKRVYPADVRKYSDGLLGIAEQQIQQRAYKVIQELQLRVERLETAKQ